MILTDEELHAADPCPDVMFDQQRLEYGRAIEREVLRKLREREPSGYLIDWPDEPDLGDYFAYEPSDCGRCRPLHIIPEVNE